MLYSTATLLICHDCRWGLQALYISWLIPATAPAAPATATFLSGLGFCGLDPSLMQALSARRSSWDTETSKGMLLLAGNTACVSQPLMQAAMQGFRHATASVQQRQGAATCHVLSSMHHG